MYQVEFTDPTIYIENHKPQVGLQQKNSVAFSPQENYIDRATAACRRS
jgi:hypothetical protein